MRVLGSVPTASPQSPAARDPHGPGGDDEKVSDVHAVPLGHAEELATRQRTVTCDRRDRQDSEHDHEENSTDPVRHSQMLVTRPELAVVRSSQGLAVRLALDYGRVVSSVARGARTRSPAVRSRSVAYRRTWSGLIGSLELAARPPSCC